MTGINPASGIGVSSQTSGPKLQGNPTKAFDAPRKTDGQAAASHKPMSTFIRSDFSQSSHTKAEALKVLQTTESANERLLHLVENGFEGSATLGAIPALHDHDSEFGVKMIKEFRALNHTVMVTNPDTPANQLGMGLSFQPSTNFNNVNEALLAGSSLSWNEAKEAMDKVPSPEVLGDATIRIVCMNREAVPAYGKEIGVQTAKHFELNVLPHNTDNAGTPFFMESSIYSKEITGDPKLGFQNLIGGDQDKGVPEPRKPTTLTERLFSPSEPNSSFGNHNVVVVSDDRNYSDIRSLAKYHNTTKLENERVLHEKQRNIIASLNTKFEPDDTISSALPDASLNRGQKALLKATLNQFGDMPMSKLNETFDKYAADRIEKLTSITPHKVAYAMELDISPQEHQVLQRHKALANAIMQKDGSLPSLGAHTAVNSCGNYAAKLIELIGLGKAEDDAGAASDAAGKSSVFEQMSSQGIDEAERRMIDAFADKEKAVFYEPSDHRSVYKDVFADGDRITKEPNLDSIKTVDANRARDLANEGMKDPALHALREGGKRASFFDQYVEVHKPDSMEAEIDKLAAKTALDILRAEAQTKQGSQELK